jgi:outer membrane protein assembly factor BamB
MTLIGQGAPAYDDSTDRLYVGFSDGHLLALDAGNGHAVWEQNLSGGSGRFVDIDMQPLIDGDYLYVATFAGNLFSLDKKSGDVVWDVGVGSGVRIAMSGETLYVAGSDGAVYAINKDNGAEIWKYQAVAGALTRPVVYGELIAVGSTEQSMLFIDAVSGRKVIQRFARKNISSDPILAGPEGNLLIYLSNAGRLYCLRLKESFRLKK